MQTSGRTRVFVILGDPVAHSLSPAMHNAAFRALGLDATYVALRCTEAMLEPVMRTVALQGGGGNITIPHKRAAAAVVARLNGWQGPVCNTFWAEHDALHAAETDSLGVRAALERLGRPDGAWCIVGTGGSARAVLEAARVAGVAVAVISRTPGRADQFRRDAERSGVHLVEPAACPVVINCTPLGLQDSDPLPVPPSDVSGARLALDLVYRRGETEWALAMKRAGCTAADGREVLVEQGAASFELWFPGIAAPREIMRAAVRAALG